MWIPEREGSARDLEPPRLLLGVLVSPDRRTLRCVARFSQRAGRPCRGGARHRDRDRAVLGDGWLGCDLAAAESGWNLSLSVAVSHQRRKRVCWILPSL